MGRYPDFTLYVQTWGGYSDTWCGEPIGMPELIWVIASADRAAICSVTSHTEGPDKRGWRAPNGGRPSLQYGWRGDGLTPIGRRLWDTVNGIRG